MLSVIAIQDVILLELWIPFSKVYFQKLLFNTVQHNTCRLSCVMYLRALSVNEVVDKVIIGVHSKA